MSPRTRTPGFRFRWSRTDSVVMQVVLGLGLALVGATTALSLLWVTTGLSVGGVGRSDRVTVQQPMEAPDTVPDVELSVDDVTIAAEPTMTLVFEDPSTVERLMLVLPALLGQAAALAVLYLVLRVIRSQGKGDPFVPANVRRVHTIAFTIILASILVPTARGLAGLFLQDGVVPAEGMVLVAFELTLGSAPLVGLLAGLVLAALAEVFRRGTRMRDDVDGLV